jgi:hypothetical protein
MSKKLRPLATIAIVAVTSAGCAGTGTGSSGANNVATNHEKAVKFSECMRNNGVSEFPDPNASGTLTLDGVVNGSKLDPNAPAWQRAIGACKTLEPSGFTGNKRTPEQQSAALKFAQCIRANGVPDFPDPTPDGPLVDTNRIPSAAAPGGMTALNAAMQNCRDAASAAGVRR